MNDDNKHKTMNIPNHSEIFTIFNPQKTDVTYRNKGKFRTIKIFV